MTVFRTATLPMTFFAIREVAKELIMVLSFMFVYLVILEEFKTHRQPESIALYCIDLLELPNELLKLDLP